MDCKRQAVRHYVMYVSDPRVLKQNHANDFVSGTDVETAWNKQTYFRIVPTLCRFVLSFAPPPNL